MEHNLLAYIPMDRRQALARGAELPDRDQGAALFADIAGFTPLTEALVRELGRQRGAEELTRYLNLVYDALIDRLHCYGGSAIAFAGDAVTCWFSGDTGHRATAAAFAMQSAMQDFAAITTPLNQTVSLTMKAAVAAGPARRFLVGDPAIRIIDALAGETLVRLAAGEHLAEKGEVIVAAEVQAALGERLEIAATRRDAQGRAFAVARRLTQPAAIAAWPDLLPAALTDAQVRPWLLPPVYARLRAGMGHFLAELRPTVALFVRFGGIDYDADPAAGSKLDAYIRWIQHVLERYQGTLIDLNIGDKGSYVYVNFGAPIAHEDNATRACAAGLDLRTPPAELSFIGPVQIGISQGRMRAGAYGGAMHRTYGVLGDEVNLAARLMMAAQPGQILVSESAQRGLDDAFVWAALPPIRVKGKTDPAVVFALQAPQRRAARHRSPTAFATPLIGRRAELAAARAHMDLARQGRGQLVSLVAAAGLGKSRLLAEIVGQGEQAGFLCVGGECEAYGVNTSYLVWQPIWRALLGVDPDGEPDEQIRQLEQRVAAINPALVRRVPLLSAVLNLAIPDNALTRAFDAKLRKTSLEGLLADCLAGLAQRRPLLIALEDCHWLDPLSHDLLETLGQTIAGLPVFVVAAYRPLELERLKDVRISALPHYVEIALDELQPADLAELARGRLAQLPGAQGRGAPAALVARMVAQAEGNPFYLEELINFIRYNGIDPDDQAALDRLELPSSLQSLVLSRLDQLGESQKTTLKVASVIGRVFRNAWLWGVYPDLGAPGHVVDDLARLTEQEFTAPATGEGEPAHAFKHIITQNVVYESLLHVVRAELHAQVGAYIEESYPDRLGQFVDLLAFHYDRSELTDKRRLYLRRAGEAAQAAYANDAAIDYYGRVLPLLDAADRADTLLKLGEVLRLVGRWDASAARYDEALSLATATGNQSTQAWSRIASGELLRLQGKYAEAWEQFTRAQIIFAAMDNRQGVAQVLHVGGTLAAQQGDYATAEARYNASLALRQQLGDRDGEARLLSNLAIIAEYQGNLDAALHLNRRSLAIRRDLGDRATIANSVNNLGNVLLARGDYAAARASLEEAVALQREIGDRWGLANALNNLGNAVRAQAGYAEARRLYTESLTINRTLGDRWALAYLLEDLGCLAALEGEAERSLVLVGAAAALRGVIGAPLPPADQAKLDQTLAPARAALGDVADAASRRGQALPLDAALDFALAR